MFLKRIFRGMPDLGPWVSVAELAAAVVTVVATLMALDVVPNPFSQAAPAGKVSGTVVDATTGKPVPEATVQIVDPNSAVIAAEPVPNAQGKWNETVKPGNYTVKAVCDGYSPIAKTVSVAASKERIVNLSIKPDTKSEMTNAAGAPAPQAAPAAAPRIVVVAPSGGGHVSGGGASASTPSGPSDEQRAKAQFDSAKKFLAAKKTDKAVEALYQAVRLDPAEGRYWANLVTVLDENNHVQAQDIARDGLKQATRNKDMLKSAAENVGVSQ